jgi:pimeloyl-ACP methyl ester carboxylesterase
MRAGMTPMGRNWRQLDGRKAMSFMTVRFFLRLIVLSMTLMTMLAPPFAEARPAFAVSPSWTEKMIDVGGYRLHFRIIEGRGSPILFEAGGGDDAGVWDEVAKSVAAITGAPVITYDRAGFGKSEVSGAADVGDHGIVAGVEGLEKGLKALGYGGEIVLVGHSYGGFYTKLYAARHPDKVRYAVLVDASTACWFDQAFFKVFRAGLPAELERLRSQGKLGQYYQSANLQQTVDVMRANAFPLSIPAIDLVSEHPPFTNESDVARWRSCHRQFTDAAPNREAITAFGTGHYIYRDNPALVVNTIVHSYASAALPAVRAKILERGLRYAMSAANDASKREATYRHSEADLNSWGYSLLAQNKLVEALEVFKLNVDMHPDSWNAYDSYGDALLKAGRKAEATAMYRKSVALNPNSASGKAALAKLINSE